MSTEKNKAIARRYIEALDRGKGVVEEVFFAPNYLYYMPGSPDPLDSKAGEQLQTMSYSAFPDLHATMEDQIAEGDAVVSRLRDTPASHLSHPFRLRGEELGSSTPPSSLWF